MLDFVSVASQVRGMREGLASLADEAGPRLDHACAAWEHAAALGPDLRDRVLRARTSWLVAEPLEPLGAYPVAVHTGYRVVASDGSQIFPDRHEMPGCFLVNVGTCDIDYLAPGAVLASRPELCWLPEDVYPLVGGERQEADTRVVGARRFAAECRALEEALDPGGPATLALMDGTLLLWWLEPDPVRLRGLAPDDLKTRTFAALEAFLARARTTGALPAGYLSSPRATDVVSMLKVVLCTEDPVDCDRCPYDAGAKTWTPLRPAPAGGMLPEPTKPCEEAEPLSDAALFARLLAAGQRSPRFRSHAKVASAYEAPVDFCYLHTGAEIARVEVPAWIDPDAFEVLLGALVDQCAKGMGYPVSLAEAHEQAVVKAADRRAFVELVRRQNVSRVSAKLVRKRMSVL